MGTPRLFEYVDVTFKILLLLDVRTLVKLRQVSRSIHMVIDNSRYLWITALEHLWLEHHTSYPHRVPIQDLPLDEIIQAAQQPYKLSYCLSNCPDRINSTSTPFKIDSGAGNTFLFGGGRWLLYVAGSSVGLALADLSSIEDGEPEVYYEPLSEGSRGRIRICDVQWYSDPHCAVVLITYQDDDVPVVLKPAVVKIVWSTTPPYVPEFRRPVVFNSLPRNIYTNRLSGDHCIFTHADQGCVIWNWNTNKFTTLSLDLKIIQILSPTELLAHEYQANPHQTVFSVIGMPPSDALNNTVHNLVHSQSLTRLPGHRRPFKLRTQDFPSKSCQLMHYETETDKKTTYGMTIISPADSSTTSPFWATHSYQFRSEASSILWRNKNVVTDSFNLAVSSDGVIHYSLLDLDTVPSTTNPTTSRFSIDPQNVPMSRLNPPSHPAVGFCGISGTVLMRVGWDAYRVVKLLAEV